MSVENCDEFDLDLLIQRATEPFSPCVKLLFTQGGHSKIIVEYNLSDQSEAGQRAIAHLQVGKVQCVSTDVKTCLLRTTKTKTWISHRVSQILMSRKWMERSQPMVSRVDEIESR